MPIFFKTEKKWQMKQKNRLTDTHMYKLMLNFFFNVRKKKLIINYFMNESGFKG